MNREHRVNVVVGAADSENPSAAAPCVFTQLGVQPGVLRGADQPLAAGRRKHYVNENEHVAVRANHAHASSDRPE